MNYEPIKIKNIIMNTEYFPKLKKFKFRFLDKKTKSSNSTVLYEYDIRYNLLQTRRDPLDTILNSKLFDIRKHLTMWAKKYHPEFLL